MTITAPLWVVVLIGLAVGLPAAAFVLLCAALAYLFAKTFIPHLRDLW